MTTQNKNIAPFPVDPEEHAIGSYAYDHLSGAVDPGAARDDMHDGNLGFHQPATLHDERSGHRDEATGLTLTDEVDPWKSSGVDVRIVNEEHLFRSPRRRTKRSADPDTDADAWMKANGHKW